MTIEADVQAFLPAISSHRALHPALHVQPVRANCGVLHGADRNSRQRGDHGPFPRLGLLTASRHDLKTAGNERD
jgi:hypothetical protein